jgi:hypothetical protein
VVGVLLAGASCYRVLGPRRVARRSVVHSMTRRRGGKIFSDLPCPPIAPISLPCGGLD